MSNESNSSNSFPPVFRIDVSADPSSRPANAQYDPNTVIIALLRQLVTGQAKQIQVLEELLQQQNSAQRQRASELGQWKQANPHLARSCRVAAESLGKVQTEFLDSLTQEINENAEVLMDGEFMLNEFVDRYGPRLAHLNGVLQVLTHLSDFLNSFSSMTSDLISFLAILSIRSLLSTTNFLTSA